MTSSNGRLTSSPRVYGTTQKVQYLEQPSMTETNAVGPSARGSGRWSNFSISGKDTSTTPSRFSCASLMRLGRRCSVCGPKTTSTAGARRRSSSPSCEATQPPTAMMTCGFASLSGFQRPICENTFSCAFSRMEQVLSRRISASSGVATGVMPCDTLSTASIFDESYSFIWQPCVSI